ncbi:ABC transporter permease [Motilibacter aurantiacus]|uniref:ABC transporter permease n=1 Tax=Motilibacter aurantiacus TaxID=2714955 RepID=UPI00140A0C4B|nr:ABC transporter permease [Motilibacter aurantiacus]NHC46099.1 ABC transporter permease [Motilibacter aurantiacus]
MSVSDAVKRQAGAGDDAQLEAGLDALALEAPSGTPRWRKWVTAAVPPLVVLAGLFALWNVLVLALNPSITKFPGPADVGAAISDQWSKGVVVEAFQGSLQRGILGFALSVLVGTAIGVVVAQVTFLRAGFGPILSGLQVLPSVAWVPVAIIWFGLTEKAMFAVILLGAVPSIANGLLSGVDQVPPLLLRVGHVLGARGFRAIWHIVLPAALPGYVAGLKQGWAFSWRSLMAAELIVRSNDIARGLGGYLDDGRQLQDMPMVFSGVFFILLVGIVIELAFFTPLERAVLKRRGLLTDRN